MKKQTNACSSQRLAIPHLAKQLSTPFTTLSGIKCLKYSISEILNIHPINCNFSPDTTFNNLLLKCKKFLSNLSNSWVLVRGACHESASSTFSIELSMSRSLRKHSHLIFLESMAHSTSTILGNHIGEKRAFNNEVEFSSSWVDMRSVESTRTKETDCEGPLLGSESRECGVVCANDLSTEAFGNAFFAASISKIEDEVVVQKELEAGDCVGCEGEFSEKSIYS